MPLHFESYLSGMFWQRPCKGVGCTLRLGLFLALLTGPTCNQKKPSQELVNTTTAPLELYLNLSQNPIRLLFKPSLHHLPPTNIAAQVCVSVGDDSGLRDLGFGATYLSRFRLGCRPATPLAVTVPTIKDRKGSIKGHFGVLVSP